MKQSITEEKLLYLLSIDDDKRLLRNKAEDDDDDDNHSNITYVTIVTYDEHSDYYNEQRPLLQKDFSETLPLYTKNHQLQQDKTSKLIGLGCVILSVILFQSMGIFVKLGGSSFPAYEIIFVRAIVEILLGVISCAHFRVNPFGYPNVRFWLILSGMLGAASIATTYYSITHLLMSDATAILYLNIPFTTLLAAIFLGESLYIFDGFCIALCFVGTMFVSKPGFLFGSSATNDGDDRYNDHDDGTSHDGDDAFSHSLAIFVSLLSAILLASVYCVVRKVGKQVHFTVYSVYNGVFLFIMCIPVLFTSESFAWPQGPIEYAALFLSGICAFAAHCFLSKGLQLAPAGFVSVINANGLPLALLSGVFIFGEYPDKLSVFGATIISVTTVLLAMRKK